MRIMLTTLLALPLTVSTAASFLKTPLAPDDEPPAPRLNKRIDYLAWVNREYGGGIRNNAAAKYRSAFAAFVDPGERVGEELGLYRSDDNGPATLSAWIRANKRCLRLFEEATQIEECYFPRQKKESETLVEVLLPHSTHFGNMGIVLRARAEQRFDAGDSAGGVDDICVMLRAARHLHAQPSMIEFWAAATMSMRAYLAVRDFVVSVRDPRDCQTIIDRLRPVDRAPVAPAKRLVIEKAGLFEFLQRNEEHPDNGQPFATQRELDIAVAEVQLIYARYERLFLEPYLKARQQNEEIQHEFEQIKDNIDPSREGEMGRTMVRLLASISASSHWRAAVAFRRLVADRNATYLILAIHAYKGKHGSWPTRLAEATTGELAQFRNDPFSNSDLVYRLDHDEPVLYSVGYNGKDDGGQRAEKSWAETGDRVYWPPNKSKP